jgi:hypothetical protein
MKIEEIFNTYNDFDSNIDRVTQVTEASKANFEELQTKLKLFIEDHEKKKKD